MFRTFSLIYVLRFILWVNIDLDITPQLVSSHMTQSVVMDMMSPLFRISLARCLMLPMSIYAFFSILHVSVPCFMAHTQCLSISFRTEFSFQFSGLPRLGDLHNHDPCSSFRNLASRNASSFMRVSIVCFLPTLILGISTVDSN